MDVNIQETKLTAEIRSTGELNKYLGEGWVLLLSYVKHKCDTQEPRFVVGWTLDGPPEFPDLLDDWERRDMMRQTLP
jgi:hypothetical protein